MARRAETPYLLETMPKSATSAEIAEMVAYNELPVEGSVGYVYVAKSGDETDVVVETVQDAGRATGADESGDGSSNGSDTHRRE